MNTQSLSSLLARTSTNLAIGLGLFGMLSVMGPAFGHASERELDLGNERVTAVPMNQYSESRIVRERSAGKESVTFTAMAGEIDEAAVVVFEIDSVSTNKTVSRWRCVAKRNVDECFAKPVKIRYLDGDERVVMKVSVQASEVPAAAIAHR